MKGTIEAIEQRTSKSSGKPYLVVTIGGEDYSLWDKKYFGQLQEGGMVEYEWKQSGDFKNIRSIQKVEGPNPNGYQPSQRERNITELALLKYATELSASTQLAPTEKLAFALHAAESYRGYLKQSEGKDEQ